MAPPMAPVAQVPLSTTPLEALAPPLAAPTVLAPLLFYPMHGLGPCLGFGLASSVALDAFGPYNRPWQLLLIEPALPIRSLARMAIDDDLVPGIKPA